MTQIINPNRPEFIQDDCPYTLVLKDNLWYNEATKKWKKNSKRAYLDKNYKFRNG